jgi:hypothetical protein
MCAHRLRAPASIPAWVLALLACTCVAACHAPLTQTIVVVESDLGSELASVRLELPELARSATVEASLPFSFGVRAPSDAASTTRLVVTGLRADGSTIVASTADVPFVRGETWRVVVRLERACVGVAGCAETCRAGVCTSASIPEGDRSRTTPGQELRELPPFPSVDAGAADAASACAPACAAGETCVEGACRCGGATCGADEICEGGGCVWFPRSCRASGRGRGCDVTSIAGGTIQLGDPDAWSDDATGAFPEQPNITVSSFRMDAYEVTVARFRAFWDAGHPVPAAAIAYPDGSTLSASRVEEPLVPGEEPISQGCPWTAAPGAHELHPISCLTRETMIAFCAFDGGAIAHGGRVGAGSARDERPNLPVGRRDADRQHRRDVRSRAGLRLRGRGRPAHASRRLVRGDLGALRSRRQRVRGRRRRLRGLRRGRQRRLLGHDRAGRIRSVTRTRRARPCEAAPRARRRTSSAAGRAARCTSRPPSTAAASAACTATEIEPSRGERDRTVSRRARSNRLAASEIEPSRGERDRTLSRRLESHLRCA